MRKSCALALAASVLSGCGFEGASSLPFPGAVGGPDTYTVAIHLADATNLVPKETCRSNDAVVGSIESVSLDEQLRAVVVCRIRNDVRLPSNAVATIKETSLLGERYVALDPSDGEQRTGELPPGADIPETSTRVDPNVEMVLGALSLVLNGGGLGQLETITRELNTALSGSDTRTTFRQLENFIATLDDHKQDITDTLVALDELAGRLARQRGVIADALDSVPDGLEALDDNRPKFVRTLRKLEDLSEVAVPLIQKTRTNSREDLKHLAAILSALTKSGNDIALAFERLAIFPFPSQTPGILRGDYAGAYFTYVLDIDTFEDLLGAPLETEATAPAAAGGATGDQDEPGADELSDGRLPIELPPLPGVTDPISGLMKPDAAAPHIDLNEILRGVS